MQRDTDIVLSHQPSRFPSAFLVTRGAILCPVLLAVAVAFIAFGSATLKESQRITSIRAAYSDVKRYQYLTSSNTCARSFSDGTVTHCQGTRSRIQVVVTEVLHPPVYMYYRLSNFYQSMSHFHDGRNSQQIAGSAPSSFLYRCEPFRRPGFLNGKLSKAVNVSGRIVAYSDFLYYPCGLAAWSMFNDTFTLYLLTDNTYVPPVDGDVPLDASKVQLVCNSSDFDEHGNPLSGSPSGANQCSKKGISRPQDVSTRFAPIRFDPLSWSAKYPFLSDDVYLENGWYADEPGHSVPNPENLDFQVWMATAAMRSFRKLFRIIDVPLNPGTYILDVEEMWDAVSFKGTKSIELRTATSWLVASNSPLGGCYVGVGIAALVGGVVVGIKAYLNSSADEKEAEEQDRREASLAEMTSAELMFSRLAGTTAEDHQRIVEARKRWYTFDLQSPYMKQYVALRLERENIRQWQLENPDDVKEDSDDSDADQESEFAFNRMGEEERHVDDETQRRAAEPHPSHYVSSAVGDVGTQSTVRRREAEV